MEEGLKLEGKLALVTGRSGDWEGSCPTSSPKRRRHRSIGHHLEKAEETAREIESIGPKAMAVRWMWLI